MRCLSIMFGLLALSGCTVAPNPATAGNGGTGGPDQQVTLDIRSWGRLVSHWRVSGDGSGEIFRVAEGGTMFEYDIRKFRLRMDAAALARFEAASNAFKQATSRPIACKLQITDMYYGNVVWSRSSAQQTFDFNYGCRSQAMDRALTMLQQVNEIVSKQSTIEAEPFATEPIGAR